MGRLSGKAMPKLRGCGNLTCWCKQIPSEPWLLGPCQALQWDQTRCPLPELGQVDPSGGYNPEFLPHFLISFVVRIRLWEEMLGHSLEHLGLEPSETGKKPAPSSWSRS